MIGKIRVCSVMLPVVVDETRELRPEFDRVGLRLIEVALREDDAALVEGGRNSR